MVIGRDVPQNVHKVSGGFDDTLIVIFAVSELFTGSNFNIRNVPNKMIKLHFDQSFFKMEFYHLLLLFV
jgi:hypothetical protein